MFCDSGFSASQYFVFWSLSQLCPRCVLATGVTRCTVNSGSSTLLLGAKIVATSQQTAGDEHADTSYNDSCRDSGDFRGLSPGRAFYTVVKSQGEAEPMHIYLVQHGAAKTEAEDAQHGLTDKGRHTSERMAEFLAALGLALDRIERRVKLRAPNSRNFGIISPIR